LNRSPRVSPGNHPGRFFFIAAAVFVACSPDDDAPVGLEPDTGPAQGIDLRVLKAEIFYLGPGVCQDLAVPGVARTQADYTVEASAGEQYQQDLAVVALG
jgi:hypothetical protein